MATKKVAAKKAVKKAAPIDLSGSYKDDQHGTLLISFAGAKPALGGPKIGKKVHVKKSGAKTTLTLED